MKKNLVTLLSAFAAMSLVACGGNKPSSSETVKTSDVTSQSVLPSSDNTESVPPATSSSEETPATSSSAETPATSSSAETPATSSSAETPVTSSSEAPASSSEAPASSEEPSSSVEPPVVKSVAYTSAALSKKDDGKVYLTVAGTAENYTAEEFKFAFGLQSTDNGGAFVYGKETPEAADYNIVVALTDNAFSVELCLTGLEGVTSGLVKIYLGPDGSYGTLNLPEGNRDRFKDGKFAYNFRNDSGTGNALAIAIDSLPPVSMQEATVFEEDGKAWIRIGGESIATPEEVATWTPYVNFQNVKDWSNTRVEGDGKVRYNTSTAGKVYIEIKVSGVFVSGGSYNTHLNITENKSQDCKMETVIDQTYKVGALQIQVFSNPNQSAAGDEGFWGNLGFRVTDNPDFVPDFNATADVTATNGAGKTVKQYHSTDGTRQRIGIDVADYSSTSENAINKTSSSGIKLNKNGSLTYEVYIDGAPSAGQKVQLSIGDTPGSATHAKKHLWNDALAKPEGAPEGTYAPYQSGQNDDKDTEDPWRIGVKVGGDDVAITNYKSLEECGLSDGKLGYIDLCEITLKNGKNTIEISQKNIGYSFVFGGELRMEWKGTSTIIADQPCEHEFVEDVCSKCNGKQYKVAIADPGEFTESSGKQNKGKSLTFSVTVDSAGEYDMYLPCKISDGAENQPLSARQLKIKVGDAAAIDPTNNTKTSSQLGLTTDAYNEALISKVTLAEGENTITISNGSSAGYRFIFDNANFYARFFK